MRGLAWGGGGGGAEGSLTWLPIWQQARAITICRSCQRLWLYLKCIFWKHFWSAVSQGCLYWIHFFLKKNQNKCNSGINKLSVQSKIGMPFPGSWKPEFMSLAQTSFCLFGRSGGRGHKITILHLYESHWVRVMYHLHGNMNTFDFWLFTCLNMFFIELI